MLVVLNTRHGFGYTVSLEWERDSGETHIVVTGYGSSCMLIFPVPARRPAKRLAIPTGTRRGVRTQVL